MKMAYKMKVVFEFVLRLRDIVEMLSIFVKGRWWRQWGRKGLSFSPLLSASNESADRLYKLYPIQQTEWGGGSLIGGEGGLREMVVTEDCDSCIAWYGLGQTYL